MTGLCFSQTPTRAEATDLYGRWEGTQDDPEVGTTTTFITFWEEGTFELRMHVVPSFNFWADMEDIDADIVEPIESLDMNVQGQWYTQADSLFLEATTMTMTANGEDLLTVMIEAMIQTLDAAGEFTAEERETFVDFIKLTLNPEDYEAELVASFNEDNASRYYFEGPTLVIEFEGDEPVQVLRLHRLEEPTAVEAITWGQLKQSLRPR